MKEIICDVRWEGPFCRADFDSLCNPNHVLYAIHGVHHLYGSNVLLYLGMTGKTPERTVADRLAEHERTWVNGEYDSVTVKVASIGIHKGIKEWWREWENMSDSYIYQRPERDIILAVEALLIYAHQPAYNTQGKGSLPTDQWLRVFNTGKCGRLLPELSYAYFAE
ncbi:hypothetical protein HYR99_27490 [Candidatus Poribacteria bacterium]|nr:hypothetical protein [Candidatus Poribacteria bacterium]